MRLKASALIIILIGFILAVSYQFISALDAPHNESNTMNCGDCHGQTLLNSPFWTNSEDYDIICTSCHTSGRAPYAETHSSLTTSSKYGDWTRQCRNCHDPHYQRQIKVYKNTDADNLYLASGTITSCEYHDPVPPADVGTSTLTYSSITYKPGWYAEKLIDKTEKGGSNKRSAVLFPNVTRLGYNYPITAVDTPTITVKGDACTTLNLTTPPTFAAIYGQYIKDSINDTPVKFLDKEGSKSFADGDTTYNGVCEVCHTQTNHFRNNGLAPDQNHANIGGAAATNCTTCHPHIDGFKPECNACHGYPPEPLATVPLPTGSSTAGAHALHATTKGYQCSICHYNSVGSGLTHKDAKITLGFVGLPGSYTGGSYDGQTTANYESSDSGTTVSNTGLKECSNIYCHGSTIAPNGGTDITPVWDNPDTGNCGTCHGASPGNPPTKGSHSKHAGAADGGRQLACTVCHYDYTSTHVDGSVNWAYDTATYTWLSGALYRGNTSGSQTPVPSTSYGQCSNLYCHSNGITTPMYTNPTWGDAASGACGTCHGVLAATPPASTPHTKHIGLTGYKYSCSRCHDSVVNATADSTTQPTIKDALLHVDKIKQVSFDTFNTGGSYSGGNCNNIYCHSKGTGGTSNPGDTRPVNISTPPLWSGTTTCGSCHGGGNASGKPEYANSSPKANNHAKHTTDCSVCHFGTTSTGTTITDKTKHVNKLYDLQAKTGYSFSYLYNVNGGSCSSISCHYNGNAQWGSILTCSSCHGFPPATGAHLTHIQSAVSQVYGSTEVISTPSSYAFGCGNCHPVSAASHGNGTVDISLNPADGGILKSKNDLTAYRAGTSTATVCYKIYCHSNGASGTGSNLAVAASPAWGTPLTGNKCGACHDNPPQYASAGAGIAGANSHYNASGFMGKEGGHMVTIHFDNIYNRVAGSGLLITGTTVDSSHGNASVATTMACYVCHSGIVSDTTIDTYSMDGTSSSFRCGACHGALQAGAITDKSKHVSGSVTVVFAPITVKSKAQLRTTSIPAGWTRTGTYGSSGSYDSTSAALNSGTWTPATKTCAVACHNGNSIQWGDTTVTCLNCHNRL
jgi:predicted CxxxxCH...CXXCH cytochrome family protein